MHNQSQFHTAGYRGNQPGHDNYLRSDSTQPSSFGYQQISNVSSASQMGYGTPVTSQYKGFQRTYQPSGFVQSVYGQGGQLSGSQYRSQAIQPSAYHTANYRGDQPGHDNYLRSDSMQPTSFSNPSFTSQNQSFQSNAQQGGFMQNLQFRNQAQSSQMQQVSSPGSYHLANYQGNQPGHDNYLRSDSEQPTSFGRGSF